MFIVAAAGGLAVLRFRCDREQSLQEFDDATLLSNGNVISQECPAPEKSTRKATGVELQAPPGTKCIPYSTCQRPRLIMRTESGPAMIINTATGRRERNPNSHDSYGHARSVSAHSHDQAGTLLVPHMARERWLRHWTA